MIEIEIDGKKIAVEQGTMVIEAADANDIRIPRFCYHKKLSVAANCRMCLVQVEKVGKPLPACATPVTPGMKVFTQSAMALDAQRSVMEFLLINHPLDCPICDQGGECELQDLSMGYGKDISRYTEGKRVVKDKDIGPLIATDMTRCIQCTRCVRFGQEVAGIRELGATGRGENMEIGTYIEHSLVSEISGNIIDLCPVGALTSKPFRFQARAWELQHAASIAPHDALGSNIAIHTRRQQVMRVVPRENEAINETWISDRDRYSYTAIDHAERLQQPRIKIDGIWQTTDWQTALLATIDGFKKIIAQKSADALGALISPSATLEECYLLQKLWREFGSQHIDHRLRQIDFTDQQQLDLYPGISDVAALEASTVILIVGSNIQREIPLLGQRIRKASLQGARICVINPMAYRFNFNITQRAIVAPHQLVQTLAAVVKVLAGEQNNFAPSLQAVLKLAEPDDTTTAMAQELKTAGNTATILFGALAAQHPQAAILRALANCIKQLLGATIGFLTDGANAAGAWLAGAIPHRLAAGQAVTQPGLDAAAMFKQALSGYLLWNIEPELDCANPTVATAALKQAEFVVCATAFSSAAMLDYADVLLPIASFAETSGTYVNLMGQWQSFAGAVPPLGEARPAWKVLRVLGSLADLAAFDYVSSEQVRDELRAMLDQAPVLPLANTQDLAFSTIDNMDEQTLMRITEWPIYRTDNLVRRAEPLQKSASSEICAAYMHPTTAEQLKLQTDQMIIATQATGTAELPIKYDERVPLNCVYIPAGFAETSNLGDSYAAIEVRGL